LKILEPVLSPNALEITRKRYLQTDLKGKVLETPGQMLYRVAHHVAKAEIAWSKNGEVEKWTGEFFDRMVNLKFVCSGKAMFEAGNPGGTGQLSACFVLGVKDSIDDIFKTLGEAALIHKNNGGTGFNFSQIRPHGDKVKNIPGAASGPVDFLSAFSAALEKILQGGKRHGGNMGILNIDHPDILDFISLKKEDQTIKNFNISVGVTDEFMQAVSDNKKWKLVNPRNGETVKTLPAKKLFETIVENAWETADPGMIFLDRMEKDNPTPTLGKLDATNPCGEQPLLPYESCNLTSLVLSNHVRSVYPSEVPSGNEGRRGASISEKNQSAKISAQEIDWEDLEKSIKTAIRFLDDMIEINTYVHPEIERIVKYGNRKIGLGVMGFGHLLYKLGISYASEEAVRLADRIAKFIKKCAEEESLSLGIERGVFPNWDISYFKDTAEKYRNATLLTIAPTGTISLFADCSSGIEPVFSLVSQRKTFFEKDKKNNSTHTLTIIDPIFKVKLDQSIQLDQSSKSKIIENLGNGLPLKDLKEIPADLKKVFVTTHDIAPIWHLKIQASFQKYFDNAVSKTINFPHDATVDDVKKAYLLAWKLGCKGITIYRDGSKQDQVLNVGNGSKTSNSTNSSNSTNLSNEKIEESNSQISNLNSQLGNCPSCGDTLIQSDGCSYCPSCGHSACSITH